MRKDRDLNIKDAVDQLLDVYKLRRKFDETALIAAWPEIIGRGIASRTKQLYIRDKKLFINVESAVIKNELFLIKSQIISRLNEHVGQEVIEDLVIIR